METWFVGAIQRREASDVLKGKPAGTFIVRDSKTSPGNFVLSYICNGVNHIRIEYTAGDGFSLHRSTSRMHFANLDGLANHYVTSETRDGVLRCRIIAPPPTGFDIKSAKRKTAAAAAAGGGGTAVSEAYEENVLRQEPGGASSGGPAVKLLVGSSTTGESSLDDSTVEDAPAPYDLWYFGALKNSQYTQLLQDAGEKSFLVRDSSSGDGLVLVVNEEGLVGNYPIAVSPNRDEYVKDVTPLRTVI